MTDRDALLRAILANPVEDLPRLAYADWLDENAGTVECKACDSTRFINRGGMSITNPPWADTCGACSGIGRVSNGFAERAEFIRVQVEIANVVAAVDEWGESDRDKTGLAALSNHLGELRRRERELQIAVCPGWREEQLGPKATEWINAPLVGGLIAPGFVNVFYTRGFVSSVTCSWSDWLAHADAILHEQPVERVKLTTRPDRMQLRDEYLKRDWHEGAHRVEIRTYDQMLRDLWPGIAFELPPEPQCTGPDYDFVIHGDPAAGIPRGIIQANPRRR